MNTQLLSGRCQILKTVAWLLLAIPHSVVASMPLALQEVDNAAQINHARGALELARLDLQQWQLEQLERLHSVGHASWLEAAQQRVAVEQLATSNRATNEFGRFLDAFRPLVESSLATVKEASAGGSAESVRLFAPNSVRLVGWLEAEQVTPELANAYRRSLQATIEEIDDLDNRWKSDLTAEHLDANRADSAKQPLTLRQQRTDLQLAIDQAELALATAQRQRRELLQRRLAMFDQATQRSTLAHPPNASQPSKSLARPGTPLIDARASDQLTRAVSNVARTEACAQGKKQALELALERQTTRVTALEKLSERGFASSQELQQAKDEQRQLQCEIKLVEAQQEMHAKVCTEFADEIATTQTVPEATPVESLPREVLCHATAVRHLLELRHAQYVAEMARHATRIQLSMLTEQFDRLQRIADQGAGQPGELKQHRLNIRECEANCLAAREQLVALRREERRFLEQFMAQRSSTCHDRQTAAGGLFDGSEWIRRFFPQFMTAIVTANYVDDVWRAAMPGFPICGYVETYAVLESDSRGSVWDALNSPAGGGTSSATVSTNIAGSRSGILSWTKWFSTSRDTGPAGESGPCLAQFVPFDLWQLNPGYLMKRPPATFRSQLPYYAAKIGVDRTRCLTQFVPFDLWQVYPGHFMKPSPTAFRSRLPHYAAEYAFGIRRLDSPSGPAGRRRATAYGGPWFFPGSPNNFRD